MEPIFPLDKTICIVDGSGYFFRAYYAIRSLANSQGLPTNAVYGFTTTLLKLLKAWKPQYIAVAFDRKEPSFRKEIYSQYKANRQAPPEDLILQIPYIKDVVNALQILSLEKAGFEADDMIASVSAYAKKNGLYCVVFSGDKDLLQLVDDTTAVYDAPKETLYDRKAVYQRFELYPEQLLDMLALAGDSADNIPGVSGIGPKTAIKLIQTYHSLDGIYNKLHEINPNAAEKLRRDKEKAYLSKKLASLAYDAPVPENLEHYQYKKADRKKISNLFSTLEFHKLANDVEFESGDNDNFIIIDAPNSQVSYEHYQTITDIDNVKDIITEIRKQGFAAVDLETTSLVTTDAQIVGIAISYQQARAFYIPVAHEEQTKQLDLAEVLSLLKPILENPSIQWIGQNIKYDYQVFKNYNITIKNVSYDTMIASYLLEAHLNTHNLDILALKYLNHNTIHFKDLFDPKEKNPQFSKVPIAKAAIYSGEDVDVTFRLKEILEKKLKEENLYDLFIRLEMPIVKILAEMEYAGVRIDDNKMKILSQQFGEEAQQITREIYELAGTEFNLNSPKQIAEIFFEKLKYPIIKKTKTGISTDHDVLERLAEEYEIPRKLLEYRTLTKLKSTYLDTLPTAVSKKTGLIHTSFNQTIAATGRLSSTDPNLQNIPIKGQYGTLIRSTFIAQEGHSFIGADYSQIELRVLAHIAKEPKLIEFFKQGKDIHTQTASQIFQVSPDDVTSDLRRQAKAVNFGIIYGMGAHRLSRELNIPYKSAKIFIDTYFERFPQILGYIDNTIQFAKEHGEVFTLFGRKRKIPEIQSKNHGLRSQAERIAVNTTIQGTAADIVKFAMIRCFEVLEDEKFQSKLILQIHDELIFESPKHEVEAVLPKIRHAMETSVSLDVPLVVDIRSGNNWAEIH